MQLYALECPVGANAVDASTKGRAPEMLKNLKARIPRTAVLNVINQFKFALSSHGVPLNNLNVATTRGLKRQKALSAAE